MTAAVKGNMRRGEQVGGEGFAQKKDANVGKNPHSKG